ncbi:MAG: hypothetical protein ACK5NY_10935 [Burkholderiaceae bacterium]|jgi:hypothetical protein
MDDSDVQLAQTPARFAQWLRALGIEPMDAPSYHVLGEFWLEFNDDDRVLIEVTPEGSLFLFGEIAHPSLSTEMPAAKLNSLLICVRHLKDTNVIDHHYQLCIKQKKFGLLSIGSIHQTRGSKVVIAELAAGVSALNSLLEQLETR